MRPLVTAEIDPVAGSCDPGDERADESVVLADQCEDRAVVVDIRVDIEELRASERRGQRVDRRLVASLEKFGTDSSGNAMDVL